jgi:hypothetical protein
MLTYMSHTSRFGFSEGSAEKIFPDELDLKNTTSKISF